MAGQNIKASVIIPTYNATKTIARCLESVLGQDYENFEIIVADDGSTDDTKKIVSGFPRVKLISGLQNKGPSRARNNAIKNSEGDLIILLDSDSYIKDKTWIKEHVEARSKYDGYLIGGGIQGIGKGIIGRSERYWWVTNIPNSNSKRPFAINHLVTNNLSFPRYIFDKIGGFDESVYSGEDILFCQEAVKFGFKLLLLSNIIIYHQDRERLKDIIKRGLKYGQDRNTLKKRGVYKYGFLLPSNPFLCFLISPLIASLLTMRIIIGWWPWDKLVLVYSPVIFVGYFFTVVGTGIGALKNSH